MTLWVQTKYINLALPLELVIDVDEAAKMYFMSRSEYIRLALQKILASEQKMPGSDAEKRKSAIYHLDDS